MTAPGQRWELDDRIVYDGTEGTVTGVRPDWPEDVQVAFDDLGARNRCVMPSTVLRPALPVRWRRWRDNPAPAGVRYYETRDLYGATYRVAGDGDWWCVIRFFFPASDIERTPPVASRENAFELLEQITAVEEASHAG